MYSKLYRNTEYFEGATISDKIYTYATTSVSIISSYLNDIRTDTVFSSNHQKKLFVRKIKDGYYHDKFFAYHINGKVWIEGNFKNGWRDGEWKEFSENGKFIAKINYKGGEVFAPDDYNQKIYDLDGRLIYNYQLSKGIRNGEAIECLYGVSDIIHKPQIHRYSYYQKNWYGHVQKFEDQKLRSYKRYQVNQLIPNFNPYFKKPQYQIKHTRFIGFNQNSMKNHIMTMSRIIGKGYYKNNIRVGKWIWKTIHDNKIVLKGEYNEEGLPIGEWIEVNTNDDDNSIITQYDKNGKVEFVSRKSKNYLK